jgi:nitrate reductase gamma subunit
MDFRKGIARLLALLLWAPIVFFSILLAHNAILYFTHGGEYGILPEKLVARQDMLWNVAFYIHLPTGILCLFAPVFLFARRYVAQSLRWHRAVGKLYVWITLLLVCPTGMYLALYAKGGLVTQTGFMLQGVLLAVFTYQGYRAIAAGDKTAHVQYMIRSYAVATVVLTFRIFHILFFFWNVPYHDNYAISQWLGLSVNILVAEVIVLMSARYLRTPITS